MIRQVSTALIALSSVAWAKIEFKDTAGEHLDVLNDGKIVVRYMYAHDTSTEERHLETYKPYLHVFDAEGKAPITKGAGGKFPHHRGLFVGWNKIGFNGKVYDRWHMKGGDIIHQEFENQEVKDGAATFTSVTHWMDAGGKPILEEARTFEISMVEGNLCFIVVKSELSAKRGDVSLKGDPEHAGVQFRPADDVEKKKTSYLFPEGVTDVKKSKDIAWAAESFTLKGQKYGVMHLSHPENPKGMVYSAYRDYGRFGAFFQADVSKGESLSFAHGIMVKTGDLPAREEIQELSDAFSKTVVKK
ncbi:MAG: PmoA family protein [Akkermansiaceae bacterium]